MFVTKLVEEECERKEEMHFVNMYRVSKKKLGSQNFQIAITHSFLAAKAAQ